MKKIYLFLTALLLSVTAVAQRHTDALDRGLVAVKVSSGVYVSWKVFGEEYYDVTYNLYRNGTKVNATPLSVSNYTDPSGSTSSKYTVAPVVRGVEQAQCEAVSVWANQYLDIKVPAALDRNGKDVTSNYEMNDVSLGDVDGDGVVELVAKRNSYNTYNMSQSAEFHHIECYNLAGKRLWWIDLGPNMLSGADEQRDAVLYDWDEDGKAEVILRGADNMIIHTADGSKIEIGDMTVDTRYSEIEYTSTGNEYLLYLEGATGKPYQIGPAEHPDYMTYPLTRGQDSDWGTGIVGHRSTKHYFGAPFLDGRKASIFLGRGAYTKHKMAAYDVDPATHALTQRWYWTSDGLSNTWFGQGYHNYGIADVDMDGRDEIVFGSMVIDDNGKGLSTTGLGHGDAQHCTDFDPYRQGLEFFGCNESSPNMNYRNATTSELYYRSVGSSDDGRGLMANFTNKFPGSTGRSVNTGLISSVADRVISDIGFDIAYSDLNNRIYWDGDLCDEILNSPGTAREAKIDKPGTGRIFTSSGCNMNNSSKNNPGAQADILGDWREEIILRCGSNLRLYTTVTPTTYRIPTLWHDHQYRNAMVWQTVGYNQPPHKSYFLGELEGITVAPPPLTMTGRTEVANGGTIQTTDEHLIVCETNDTEISIADGASPYMLTFNVPTWVQGSNNNKNITYSKFTCNVTGGALTGSTRLVKQGDGILNLPKADMTHTGETNVWAGTLNFDGTMKNSDLWLNRFTELNSDGGAFKSLKADYGSVIRPGRADNVGAITIAGTYTMGFGSRLVLDISAGTIDQISCATLVVESKNWQYGPKYLMPVIELAGEPAEGKYLIGTVGALTGSLSNIKIEGQGSLKAGLALEDNNLYLTLGGVRGASHIVWTGSESNIWDYASTTNFYLAGDETMTPDVFVANDIVDFTDSAAQKAVSIKDEITLDTMYVNNTEAYTFTGSGKIVGGAFVKEGTGTVTMNNDNTFTGGVFLRGGTTKVSTLSSNTQTYGGLGGVQTNSNKFVIENGAVLNTTADVQNGSPIRVSGAEGGVITNNSGFTQQKAVTGTVLTKRGSGWMTLSAANGSLQKLVITAGGVGATATPAKAVEMQGGELQVGGGSATPVTIPAGKKATIRYTEDRSTYNNALNGAGTITIYYPLVKGGDWYATRCQINGNWTAFEGTIVPTTGVAADGRFCVNNSGAPKATFNIPAGTVIESPGKTYAIGKLAGEGSLGGTCSFSSAAAAAWATWNVGNDEDFTFKGKVTRNAKFTKTGKGSMTVSGVWDNTGTVTVKAGTLKLSNTAVLGTGTLTVSAEATLTGTNKKATPLTNSSVTVSGTLRPGLLANATTGTMYFDNKSVTFKPGSTLLIGLRRCATASATGGTSLQGINRITMNGTISVFLDEEYIPVVGDSMYLWKSNTFTGTPEFDLPVLTGGLMWDTSSISEGLLRIAEDPTAIDNIPADTEAEVTVLTVGGTAISRFTAPFGSVETAFRQSDAPSGVYMLRIKTANGTVVRKVLK